MSSQVEKAARVLFEHFSRTDGLDVSALESAQALADAGLLREADTDQAEAIRAVAEQMRISNLISLAALPSIDAREEVRDALREEALRILAGG